LEPKFNLDFGIAQNDKREDAKIKCL
jgi:hypothetical protein